MKKLSLCLGFAAAVMFTGCGNDETVEMVPQKAIGFSSFVNKSTKAVTDVTTANITSIWVYGWRTKSSADEALFTKQSVTKSGSDWTYSPLRYWEPGYTYTFEAIAPEPGATSGGVTFAQAKGGGTVTFVNDATTDLVYAKPVTKDFSSKNFTDITNTTPGMVDFTFNHLLSRVKFTFKNILESSSNAKITVSDVKITNAYKNGSVTPNTSTTWTSLSEQNLEVGFEPSTTGALTDIAPNNSGDTEHKYLIPTDNTVSYNVTFKFKLDQGGLTTEFDRTATISSVAMESGKSYNFIAELGLQPIKFTVTVTEWPDFTTTPGTGSITVN